MDTGACDIWRFFNHEGDYADIDTDAACARLGKVLSFATVSHMDNDAVDWRPFDDLRAYMADAWPHVFAAGDVEVIDHSLLVTLPGSDASLKPVMLMGHMDVVPVVPGTEGDWTHGAFSGAVDDTFVWGRGAIDMKCQVAGELEAVEYVLAHGWGLKRTLILAFGQDEETNQFGARAVAAELRRRGVELEFLLDEGDYRIVNSAEYGVPGAWLMHADLAEKGYADIVLSVKSEGGHSSNPYGGTSLEKLARAITAICNIEWAPLLTALTAATLTELGLVSAEDVADSAKRAEIIECCLADKRLYPLVQTTCAPTQIEGGSAGANVMPQDMWANINFRMMPGVSVDNVLLASRAAVRAAGLDDVEVALGPGSSEPSPDPAVGGPGLDALRTVAARYFVEPAPVAGTVGGEDDFDRQSAGRRTVHIVPSMVIGATDAANYACICPECLRFSAFVVADEECDGGVHGTDERITRRAYLQGIRFSIRLIQETCL